jgi:hypothetical protein
MSELAKGGCLCGNFHYSFPREAVISTFHCHCNDCQKSTGSGKATLLLVPKAVLSSKGELKTFTVKGTEGSSVSRGFCPDCGSPLLSHVEEMPDLFMVKAGSLEDSSWVSADLSCWGSSAQPWLPVDANTPVCDKNPDLQG